MSCHTEYIEPSSVYTHITTHSTVGVDITNLIKVVYTCEDVEQRHDDKAFYNRDQCHKKTHGEEEKQLTHNIEDCTHDECDTRQ